MPAKRLGMVFSDEMTLEPPDSAVELRTYGFGVMPFDGQFTRFRGCMRYDPATIAVGDVVLQIEAASLVMSNEPIRDLILGSGMLDAVRYPTLAFRGIGQGEHVVGELTMHGETRALTLDYSRSAGTVTATGRLRRESWGITGAQLIGGSIIRIRMVVPDPFTRWPI